MKFVVIVFFMPVLAAAQIRFEKGYFIDNQDRRTECMIRDADWLLNPVALKYKLSEEGEVREATIEEVREFAVANNRYIRAEVKLDTSLQDVKKLSSNKYPEWKTKTVFLKVLLDSKASLFKYRESGIVKFFYSVDASPPQQLVYKESRKSADQLAYNLEYLQQLRNHVTCKPISNEALKKIRYEETALLKHFISFNECKGVTMKQAEKKKSFHLSVALGVDQGAYTVDFPNREYEYQKEVAPRFGLTAEIVLPFQNGKWSILIDPTYQSYKLPDSVDYTSIEIPLGLRYAVFLSRQSSIFFNAFLVSDFPLTQQVDYPLVLKENKSPSLSAAAGVGFRFGRLSIEPRYYFQRRTLSARNNDDIWQVYSKASIIAAFRIF